MLRNVNDAYLGPNSRYYKEYHELEELSKEESFKKVKRKPILKNTIVEE